MVENTSPTASAGPPPTVDAQDPLPESNWFYRRVFIFSLTVVLIFGCMWTIWPLRILAYAGNKDAIMGLIDLPFYQMGLILTLVIFYTVAPSGEQVAKMFNLSSILTRGVGWMTQSQATSPGGGSATTTTTVTPAPQPNGAGPDTGAGPIPVDRTVMGVSLADANSGELIASLPWNKKG